MAHIWPELVEGLNVMPSMPEYTEAEDTPGVSSTMGTTRCTMASVRARLLPGGMVIEIVIVDLVLHGHEAARRIDHAPGRQPHQARVQHQHQRAAPAAPPRSARL